MKGSPMFRTIHRTELASYAAAATIALTSTLTLAAIMLSSLAVPASGVVA